MYEPQEPPAVYSSVLASSVIIMAAGSCLLPPCVVPAFGLRLYIPELLSDALLFRRGLLGLLPSVDLPLPCGQIAVVLLHKGCSGVIRPFERLHIGIAVLFQNTGQPVHPAVDLLLYTFNLFLQGLALFSFEQSSRFSELPFQLWKLYVHELLNRPGFVLYLAHQLLHGAVFRHIN